jgi:voltage-gated potassium channel
MYFIAAGEVEIELKNERVRLGAGHFFGEVAALRRTRRSATVTAVTRTNLLVLDAHDLHVLMDREPRIAERIHEVARSRLGGDVISPKGDLVAEELEDSDTVEPRQPATAVRDAKSKVSHNRPRLVLIGRRLRLLPATGGFP